MSYDESVSTEAWRATLQEYLDEWQLEDCPDRAGHPAAERMSRLGESFHVLVGKPGVRPWSPMALAKSAFLGPALSGPSQLTAVFVLKVWNRDFPCPEFDAIDALSRWDADHRRAFVAWASDPWFP